MLVKFGFVLQNPRVQDDAAFPIFYLRINDQEAGFVNVETRLIFVEKVDSFVALLYEFFS